MISIIANSLTVIPTEMITYYFFLVIVACLIILISLQILLKTQLPNYSVKRFLRVVNIAIVPLQVFFVLFIIYKFILLF